MSQVNMVVTVSAFVPEEEDELLFDEGEFIEVLERDVFGDGNWCRGRNKSKVGLFPSTHVRNLVVSDDLGSPPISKSPQRNSKSSGKKEKKKKKKSSSRRGSGTEPLVPLHIPQEAIGKIRAINLREHAGEDAALVAVAESLQEALIGGNCDRVTAVAMDTRVLMEAAGIVSKQLRMKIVLLRNYMDYLYGGNASAAAVIQVLEDNLAKGNDDQSLVDQKRGKKQQQEGDDEQPPALPARDTPHSKARPPQGSSAYVALWGFPGHHENELEVAMGETLYAKGSDNPDEDSPWMYLCNEKGYSGYVPREYLREKVLLRQESVRISGGGGGGGGGTIRGTMRGTVRSRQSNFFASYEQSCYEKEGSRQSILATPPEQVQGGRGDADKGSVEGDGDMDDENDEGDVDPLMPVTQREFIVQEMVETERSYNQGLWIILNLYRAPLEKLVKSGKAKGDNWLKPTQFQMIFSNIDPIYTMSCTFLKELEKCYADWILSERTADGNHSSPLRLGSVFSQMIPFMKIYVEHKKSVEEALKLLEAVANGEHKKFGKFLVEAKQDPKGGGLSLDMLLIMPIQRLPRYRLLLEEVIKHTKEDDPDYPSLISALHKTKDVCNSVNASNDADRMNTVLAIQRKLGLGCPELVVPHRTFLYFGSLKWLKQGRTGMEYAGQLGLYVFNDVIVFSFKKRFFGILSYDYVWIVDMPAAKPTDNDSHQFLPHTLLQPTWCDACKKFIYGLHKQCVRCCRCRLTVHDSCKSSCPSGCLGLDDPQLRHLIKITSPNSWFLLAADDEETKQGAIVGLVEAVEAHVKSNRNVEERRRNKLQSQGKSFLQVESATLLAESNGNEEECNWDELMPPYIELKGITLGDTLAALTESSGKGKDGKGRKVSSADSTDLSVQDYCTAVCEEVLESHLDGQESRKGVSGRGRGGGEKEEDEEVDIANLICAPPGLTNAASAASSASAPSPSEILLARRVQRDSTKIDTLRADFKNRSVNYSKRNLQTLARDGDTKRATTTDVKTMSTPTLSASSASSKSEAAANLPKGKQSSSKKAKSSGNVGLKGSGGGKIEKEKKSSGKSSAKSSSSTIMENKKQEDSMIIKEGHLKRKTKTRGVSSTKSRYCRLSKSGELLEFKQVNSAKPSSITRVSDVKAVAPLKDSSNFGFVIISKAKEVFYASNEGERKSWLDALELAMMDGVTNVAPVAPIYDKNVEGYVHLLFGSKWKMRYCRLTANTIEVYRKPGAVCEGRVSLDNCRVRKLNMSSVKGSPFGFVVASPRGSNMFYLESEADMKNWVNAVYSVSNGLDVRRSVLPGNDSAAKSGQAKQPAAGQEGRDRTHSEPQPQRLVSTISPSPRQQGEAAQAQVDPFAVVDTGKSGVYVIENSNNAKETIAISTSACDSSPFRSESGSNSSSYSDSGAMSASSEVPWVDPSTFFTGQQSSPLWVSDPATTSSSVEGQKPKHSSASLDGSEEEDSSSYASSEEDAEEIDSSQVVTNKKFVSRGYSRTAVLAPAATKSKLDVVKEIYKRKEEEERERERLVRVQLEKESQISNPTSERESRANQRAVEYGQRGGGAANNPMSLDEVLATYESEPMPAKPGDTPQLAANEKRELSNDTKRKLAAMGVIVGRMSDDDDDESSGEEEYSDDDGDDVVQQTSRVGTGLDTCQSKKNVLAKEGRGTGVDNMVNLVVGDGKSTLSRPHRPSATTNVTPSATAKPAPWKSNTAMATSSPTQQNQHRHAQTQHTTPVAAGSVSLAYEPAKVVPLSRQQQEHLYEEQRQMELRYEQQQKELQQQQQRQQQQKSLNQQAPRPSRAAGNIDSTQSQSAGHLYSSTTSKQQPRSTSQFTSSPQRSMPNLTTSSIPHSAASVSGAQSSADPFEIRVACTRAISDASTLLSEGSRARQSSGAVINMNDLIERLAATVQTLRGLISSSGAYAPPSLSNVLRNVQEMLVWAQTTSSPHLTSSSSPARGAAASPSHSYSAPSPSPSSSRIYGGAQQNYAHQSTHPPQQSLGTEIPIDFSNNVTYLEDDYSASGGSSDPPAVAFTSVSSVWSNPQPAAPSTAQKTAEQGRQRRSTVAASNPSSARSVWASSTDLIPTSPAASPSSTTFTTGGGRSQEYFGGSSATRAPAPSLRSSQTVVNTVASSTYNSQQQPSAAAGGAREVVRTASKPALNKRASRRMNDSELQSLANRSRKNMYEDEI